MDSNIGLPATELNETLIRQIDARVEAPYLVYTRVLNVIKERCADLTEADLLMFSSHYLSTAFLPETQYAKMARALLANVYFLHYQSELIDGLQHSTGKRSEDEGMARNAGQEQRTDSSHRSDGPKETSLPSESSSSVSGTTKLPEVLRSKEDV